MDGVTRPRKSRWRKTGCEDQAAYQGQAFSPVPSLLRACFWVAEQRSTTEVPLHFALIHACSQ